MNSLSFERLYYYLACLDELRESREDIGLRRARADGLITDLLRELAQLLPEDDRILVLAIVGKHDRLWSASSVSPKPERPVALIEAYRQKQAESSTSSKWGAYGRIAQALEQKGSLPGGVRRVHSLLANLQKDLPKLPDDWIRKGVLEQKVIYEEFLSLPAVRECAE